VDILNIYSCRNIIDYTLTFLLYDFRMALLRFEAAAFPVLALKAHLLLNYNFSRISPYLWNGLILMRYSPFGKFTKYDTK
jgi:hypothetical protein